MDLSVFVNNTYKIKISASQRISIKNCMNYDHNKMFGLFKSGYRNLYFNSPMGYSRKITNTQTADNSLVIIYYFLFKTNRNFFKCSFTIENVTLGGIAQCMYIKKVCC